MSRWLALLAAALPAACAVEMPAVPLREFTAGDLGTVQQFAAAEVAEGDEENFALVLNIQAQCELLLGRLEEAGRHFETAGRVMGNWATAGSETFEAVVGSESSKSWKGDPYEKAMNAFYLGLTFLWRGEPDNARAAFKRGILADGESGDEKYQTDFTLLLWLAGRMSALMGSPEDATSFYAEAAQANEFSIAHGSRGRDPDPVLEAPGAGNLVVLVECGLGPEKYAAGGEEELARFRPRWHPAEGARVWLDGQQLGNTSVLADVDYQARTRGGTEMEGIRQGKAVFKSVSRTAGVVLLGLGAMDDSAKGQRDKLIVGGGLLLASLLTSSAADVRHWPTLPSTVQVLCADVAPGAHELVLEFLDGSGRVLTDLEQRWSVVVPEQGESYYLFRSLPGLDRIRQSEEPTR